MNDAGTILSEPNHARQRPSGCSADEALVKRMREHASRRGASLNNMIREYMEQVTGSGDAKRNANEFARLASEHAGRSPKGFHFDRESTHKR